MNFLRKVIITILSFLVIFGALPFLERKASEYDLVLHNILYFLISALTISNIIFILIFRYNKNKYKHDLYKINSIINTISTISPIGYYYWNKKNNSEEFSHSLKKILHLPEEAVYFRDFSICFNEEDLDTIGKYLDDILESNNNSEKISSNAPIRVSFTSGKELKKRFVECIGNKIVDEKNTIIGALLCMRDITFEVIYYEAIINENEKLKEQITNLSTLLNETPFPIWVRDKDLNITYFNFFYSELIAQFEDKDYNPEILEIDKYAKELAKKAIEQKIIKYDKRYIYNNGQRKLYNFIEVPDKNNNNTIGFAFDIDNEQKLKQELDRYIQAQVNLLESSSSAMAIYSSDRKLKLYNQAFVNLWSLDQKWLNSHPTYEEVLDILREKRLLPEQVDFQRYRQDQIRYFRDLMDTHNDFLHLPDGRSLRVIIIPFSLGGLLFAYEDMTDRLVLERSYNTMIAVQKSIINNLNEAILVISENGRIKLYNQQYLKLWGFTESDLNCSPHFLELIEKNRKYYECDNWEEVKKSILSHINKREKVFQLVKLVNGKVIHRVIAPLPDGATIILNMDVTDSYLVEKSLREKNEALQEADRIKSEFLANISYELRSPLTTIKGYTESIAKGYLGQINDKQSEYLSIIANASDYLINLINDIIDLASIEAGYIKLDLNEFDINQLIIETIKIFEKRAKISDITITFKENKELKLFVGDKKRLTQIILKLLNNAIDYNRENGRINIDIVKYPDNQIAIIIEDTGIGIEESELNKIFDKFYKTQYSKDLSSNGAGLGLSLVKNLVELHGGKIIIESTLDIGTKVTCVLPQTSIEH